MSKFEPLSPACAKCKCVTGNATCFPGPCIFYRERSIAGTASHGIATIERVRSGGRPG